MKKNKLNNSINSFINSIQNIRWFIITMFIYFVIQVLLNPDILHVAYLHAEDGKVFLNDFVLNGFKSFFMTQGGYFCTVSRLFAAISYILGYITNSAIVMVNTLNVVSIIFVSLALSYFSSDEFNELIPSRLYRLIICISIICLGSNFYALLYNGVGIHWWCGLIVVFASINLLNLKTPSIKYLPLILISIISSASTMVLGFAIFYYIIRKVDFKNIKKSINKIAIKEKVTILLLVFFLVIQAYAILFMGSAVSDSVEKISYSKLIFYTLAETFQSSNFILGTTFYSSISASNISLNIGVLLWVIMLFVLLKNDKIKYGLLIFVQIFATYFMISYKNPDIISQYIYFTKTRCVIFYNFLPAISTLLLFLICIYDYVKKERKYLYLLLFSILAFSFVFIDNKDTIDLIDNQDLIKINKKVDFKSKKITKIGITPYNSWYVYIPVEEGYCNEIECTDKK